MKTRSGFAALLLLACAVSAAGQEQPQIGYRILSGYMEKKQSEGDGGRKGAGTVIATAGGLMLAGAATTFFWGDDISRGFSGYPMDPSIKASVSLGLGIGGLVTAGIGAGILGGKPRNYRAEYSEVFSEKDTQIREALAVAALKDLSTKGKKNRVTGALMNLMVPLVYGAVRAGMNVTENRVWSDHVMDGMYWSAWNIASGLSSLFGISEEERLYDKYLAGREALYGERAVSSKP